PPAAAPAPASTTTPSTPTGARSCCRLRRGCWGGMYMPDEGTDEEQSPDERLRRWRLALGGAPGAEGTGFGLTGSDVAVAAALGALYDSAPGDGTPTPRGAGLGASAPRVARWLGDIRQYFPSTVVQVMQADAIERLNLTRLLLEPEMLDAV